MSNSQQNERINHYKNHDKNSENMRLRRHEATIELRKAKKEDQLFKRRNIHCGESALRENNGSSFAYTTEDKIVEAMKSPDPALQLAAVVETRKMLSQGGGNPPINSIISHGIVPLCVGFLQNFDNPMLQFEAAWALTNIASGTAEQTKCVIDHGAIPLFIQLIQSKNMNLAEQAVWALGNIAGDGPTARDILLIENIVDAILALVVNQIPLSFLRNLTWLMSNLCRHKNSVPPFDQIEHLLPIFARLLLETDKEILSDVCWAFSYITDYGNTEIQAVIDIGVVPHLVAQLDSGKPNIIVPALRSLGNIVTGTDIQTDVVITAGVLPKLNLLLLNPKNNIVREAAWMVSNIVAGTSAQLQSIIDADIFKNINKVMERGDFKSQREAAWTVTNATTTGTPEQLILLIEKYQILKPFCDLLDCRDTPTIKVVQAGLANFFALAEKLCATSDLCIIIEEIGGLDKLENLQHHENREVYKNAFSLIDKYFSGGGEADDDMTVELAPQEKESFEFKPPKPEGGCNF